jgi:invasion protein IalB
MKLLGLTLLSASLAATSAAVSAQQQPQAQPQAAGSGLNPNEVICEKQDVTGSRLAHRKVCMTRSQWEDTRRQDRSAVEKVQTERGLIAPVPGG